MKSRSWRVDWTMVLAAVAWGSGCGGGGSSNSTPQCKPTSAGAWQGDYVMTSAGLCSTLQASGHISLTLSLAAGQVSGTAAIGDFIVQGSGLCAVQPGPGSFVVSGTDDGYGGLDLYLSAPGASGWTLSISGQVTGDQLTGQMFDPFGTAPLNLTRAPGGGGCGGGAGAGGSSGSGGTTLPGGTGGGGTGAVLGGGSSTLGSGGAVGTAPLSTAPIGGTSAAGGIGVAGMPAGGGGIGGGGSEGLDGGGGDTRDATATDGEVGCTSGAPGCRDTGTSGGPGTPCGVNMVLDGTGACIACTDGAACMGSNPCTAAVIVCASGAPICTDSTPMPNGTACDTGKVCDNGACVACAQGGVCTPSNPCHAGTLDCSAGTPVCSDTGIPLANGTTCGTDMVCNAGACAACAANVICTPSTPCHAGVTTCTEGFQTCTDQGTLLGPGTSCGTNSVCNATGDCIACTTGAACTSATACRTASLVCATGAPVCTDNGLAPAGADCGGNKTCNSTGSCVCALTTCGTACVDLQADTHNCGRCGHDCLGGLCSKGACQPFTVVPSQAPASIASIAIDAKNIYFTANASTGSVASAPLAGGTVTTLAPSQTNPQGIAVDATSVYWSNSSWDTGSIMKVPVGGGTAVPLASGISTSGTIVIDQTNAYWTESKPGSLRVAGVPLLGGSVFTVTALTQSPSGLAVDATYLYWADGYNCCSSGAITLEKVVKSGGSIVPLASLGSQNPNGSAGMVSDGTTVFFSSNNMLGSIPVSGGSVNPLVTPVSFTGIVLDASNVYFNSGNGGNYVLTVVPKTGGTGVTLANDASNSLAVDGSALYYAAGTEIKKVALP